MHPEQLHRRPAERGGLIPVLLNEVEGVGPDASPCARLEARAGIAVGGEGEESLAPDLRALCRSFWCGPLCIRTPCTKIPKITENPAKGILGQCEMSRSL